VIGFFDATVLVATMVEDEQRHEACAQVLNEAEDRYASIHPLAECYATLTGGRLGVQLPPGDAANLVRSNVLVDFRWLA